MEELATLSSETATGLGVVFADAARLRGSWAFHSCIYSGVDAAGLIYTELAANTM